MTDQELRDLVARLAEESDKVKKAQQQTERAQRQTEKELRRTLKALGRLGNSLGEMTEGLVYPSVAKILRQRFKADFVARNARRGGRECPACDSFGVCRRRGKRFVPRIMRNSVSTPNQPLLVNL